MPQPFRIGRESPSAVALFAELGLKTATAGARLTDRQAQAFQIYLDVGNIALVAEELGITKQAASVLLHTAFRNVEQFAKALE